MHGVGRQPDRRSSCLDLIGHHGDARISPPSTMISVPVM
jgi:hypothetical protein